MKILGRVFGVVLWIGIWVGFEFGTGDGARAGSAAFLADAAEAGDDSRVRDLLASGADVNGAQADGMTALHWAVYLDRLEMAEKLIKAGAEAGRENLYGVKPLSLACLNGNEPMVGLLLRSGAAASTALRGGETALMTASRTGRLGVVEALLAHGADVNARERRGQTALMWAAAEGHAAAAEALIRAGADFLTPLESGFTPLFFAAREGRTEVARALLRAGADVNGVMEPRRSVGKGVRAGTSPLLLAVENGHFELAAALLEAGADPNDQRSGFTALHALTWVRKPNRGDGEDGDPAPIGSGNMSSLQFVERLVRHGADVNARLKSGRSGRGQLNRTGATPFLLAAMTADAPLLRLLAKLGADPMLGNADGATPLMAAAGLGTLAPGEEAGTEEEALEALDYLLSLGAEINTVDSNGETAMHGAAYKSFPKVAAWLADRGAKIDVWNRANKWGWTPLHIAEGYRPGNFKPSAETVAALHQAYLRSGIAPPAVAAPSELAPSDYAPAAASPRKAALGPSGGSGAASARVVRDIEYARVGEVSLKLDLHLPGDTGAGLGSVPLIVWVHGGAWRSGSKTQMPLGKLVEKGYPIASVDYRLSTQAKFPAQAHDIKAAVRFLRGRGAKWKLPADKLRIVMAGDSAGAHLAALAGVSNGHPELEGRVGEDLQESSDAQGIVSFYGASNLTTILGQSTPHGLKVRIPALDLLLGGQPEAVPELARLASPVFHVDAGDPPLLLLHGDQDPQMPINQAHELAAAYRKAKARVSFEAVSGGGHGGAIFYDDERLDLVLRFLREHCGGE